MTWHRGGCGTSALDVYSEDSGFANVGVLWGAGVGAERADGEAGAGAERAYGESSSGHASSSASCLPIGVFDVFWLL